MIAFILLLVAVFLFLADAFFHVSLGSVGLLSLALGLGFLGIALAHWPGPNRVP